MLHEAKVKDFYFIMKFMKDGSRVTRIVHGVEILLDELSLGEILDIFIEGIKTVKN